MLSDEAIEVTTAFSHGRPIGDRRLLLEHLEHLDNEGFTVAPGDCLIATRDAGADALKLPVPRLQLRWDEDNNCHYEMILRLSEHDIRRETRDDDGDLKRTMSPFMAIPLGRTRVSGGGGHVFGGVVRAPYRDGAHASWDAAQLGLPVYAVCGEHATLLEAKMPPSFAAEMTP